MLTFMDWMLLCLIYRFSCPFYSSAVSCPLVMYCTRSELTGTQWGFNPCEALWHWSRLGVRADWAVLLSEACSLLCSIGSTLEYITIILTFVLKKNLPTGLLKLLWNISARNGMLHKFKLYSTSDSQIFIFRSPFQMTNASFTHNHKIHVYVSVKCFKCFVFCFLANTQLEIIYLSGFEWLYLFLNLKKFTFNKTVAIFCWPRAKNVHLWLITGYI